MHVSVKVFRTKPANFKLRLFYVALLAVCTVHCTVLIRADLVYQLSGIPAGRCADTLRDRA